MVDFRDSTWTGSKVGLKTTSDKKLTASLTWFLLKKRVNLLISLSTSTSRTPPNLSIHSSTCYFEYVWVPLRAPWATNWATELFSSVYCLLPTLTLTVMAAWLPGQYSVATLTPLLSLVTVVALEAWRASGISPHGNYPKSTNRFLLNWRYYLREGAWVWALVTWEKAALSLRVEMTDLETRFIINI